MHPAYSVIIFTTASGTGYGLLLLLGLASAGGLLPADRWFALTAFMLSFALITGGLLSSTFHLGHPERAWRAVTQWRSSWLSREGIMALVTYLPAVLFAAGWVLWEATGGIWAGLGVLAALCAVLTIYCTAMIYRSLAAVPAWHHPLVPLVYLVLALSGGAIVLDAVLAIFAVSQPIVGYIAIAATVAGWGLKLAYWSSVDRNTPESTVESATGLGHLGKVRLLDAPHTQENYLLKEMGYRVARKHARKLRRLAQGLAFAAPVMLVALHLLLPGVIGAIAAVLAALSAIAGLLVERWLFFAEAKHKVTLYYGADAV